MPNLAQGPPNIADASVSNLLPSLFKLPLEAGIKFESPGSRDSFFSLYFFSLLNFLSCSTRAWRSEQVILLCVGWCTYQFNFIMLSRSGVSRQGVPPLPPKGRTVRGGRFTTPMLPLTTGRRHSPRFTATQSEESQPLLTPPADEHANPPPMGNITMHPNLAEVPLESQVTVDTTIHEEDSVVGNIQFVQSDCEFEHGEEEEWGDINEFSSSEFPINERVSFYMGRVPISNDNRQAVEFCYMVEAESLVRSQNTLKKPELAAKLLEKYKQLIIEIPLHRFGEFGSKELMVKGYFNCKSGSTGGFMTKVKEVKAKVQVASRKMAGVGSPLSKISSGKGILDVKKLFIIDRYKDEMGPVSTS